jgi:CRP/FNR family nitrogen fixation transcriptional regulator
MQLSTQRVPGRVSRYACPVIAHPDALDLLEQFGTTIHASANEDIHAEGARADHCYRVLSGCVRTVQLLADGRRQVGEFLMTGDMFGLDDLDTHVFAAEAVTAVVLRRYPRRMQAALAERNPGLARRLHDLTLAHLHRTCRHAMALGRMTAGERLAAFLLQMDRCLPPLENGLLNLPMSRTDIADHLGLTVETVCRLLAVFKGNGSVAVCRAGIRLLNRTALRGMACETMH